MVLELLCHKERWLSDDFGSNSNVALLNKSDWLFHGLGVFKGTKQNSKSTAAEGWNWYFLRGLDVFPCINDPHVVQFFKQLFSGLDSKFIIRRKLFNFRDEGCDHATDLVIVLVVVSLLQMILMNDFSLSLISLNFPVIKVNFLQEFLLMMLEFSHFCYYRKLILLYFLSKVWESCWVRNILKDFKL